MLNNRNSVLAIALIMVVVYHFPYNPIGRFNIGYMGVDIFLFYSGYGICKSLLKNKIATFYKNRLKRIFPMFAVLTLCMAALKGTLNDISLLLQQITTLAFYVNPDYATDWYLSSLFLFYLLSPACLFIVKKCKQGYVLILIVTFLFLRFIEVPMWQYQCLIGRIPIYILGIFYSYYKIEAISLKYSLPLFVSGCFFWFYGYRYLGTDLMALLIIQLIIPTLKRTRLLDNRILYYVGSHSLEFYIGNVITLQMQHLFSGSLLFVCVFNILGTIILGYLFVLLNERILTPFVDMIIEKK